MDILSTLSREGPVGITRLLVAANLTHGRVQELIGMMEQQGLAAPSEEGDRTQWMITPKGTRALMELKRIDRAMSDFGLGL